MQTRLQAGALLLPRPGDNDLCNLAPAWKSATELLESNRQRTVAVSEIYDIWRQPPYGVKMACCRSWAQHSFCLSAGRWPSTGRASSRLV